jgi:hypothetical protein
MSLPSKEKYIMFLENKYFKKNIFKSVYNKIVKRLKNKGIVLFEIETAVEKLKILHKNINRKCNITFDDNPFPNTNTLYIHLFNNQYYTDKNYNKKKVEIEREMLFLLAGKLGVKEINYETEVIETTITKLDSKVNMKGINTGLTFNKNINRTKGTKGNEQYLNRGAPVYLKSENIQEVDKNIEDRMGMMQSNIFNYNFYKNNPKLESFVYKRFEFKMLKLEYTIETDDLSDISFAVHSCFMQYGIEISYDKTTNYSENIYYLIEFYTDTELYKEFGKNKRNHMDEFYSIRELYELMDDKDKAVHLITEYVIKYATNYKYKLKDLDNIYNFSRNIDEYIKNNEPGSFEGVCHQFHSTSQIKNWINKMFLTNDMIIVDINIETIIEPVVSTIIEPVVLTIIEPIIEPIKVNQFEKEYLDKSTKDYNIRIENLQKEIETIANEDEIKNIINNCDGNKKLPTELNIPVIINDWELDENNIHKSKSEPIINIPFGFNDNMFAHYLCTMVNPTVETSRPPILPSSSTTSINSEDKSPNFLPPPVINDRESDI